MHGYKVLNRDYTYKGIKYNPIAEWPNNFCLSDKGFYFFTDLSIVAKKYNFSRNFVLAVVQSEDEYNEISPGYYICKKIRVSEILSHEQACELLTFEVNNNDLKCRFVNGLLVGDYKSYYNGKLQEHRTYRNGKIHGKCIYYFENGQIMEIAYYKNNKYHGPYEEYNEASIIIKKCSYKNDDLINDYKEWYDSGFLKKHYFYLEGEILHGSYKDYYENGQISDERNYINGELHGTCTEYGPSGYVVEIVNYHNGALHGQSREWYDATHIKLEENYVMNNLVGNRKKYYANGQLQLEEVYNQEGKLHGIQMLFHEDGRKNSLFRYDNGQKHGLVVSKYNENNTPKQIILYENGEQKYYKNYFTNYQVQEEFAVLNGELHGICIKYYETGQKRQEYTHVHGKIHGQFLAYGTRGQIILSKIYNMGVDTTNQMNVE